MFTAWAEDHASNEIGGKDEVVEMYESYFGKVTRESDRDISEWVIGGIQLTSKEFFFIPVDFLDKSTLLSIVNKYIKPGTTVVSDCWEDYECYDDEEFQDLAREKSLLPSLYFIVHYHYFY